MKKSILAKTFGYALATAVVTSALVLPTNAVSANDDADTVDGESVFSLEEEADHVAGQLIVTTKGVDLNAATSIEDTFTSIDKLDYSFDGDIYLLQCEGDLTAEEVKDLFSDMSGILHVQYNYIYELEPEHEGAGVEVSPYKGWENDYVQAAAAWNLIDSTAHSKVRVGIVDQGVDLTHSEFEGIINADLSYDCYYQEPLTSKGFGDHGTHVAGIVAGRNSGADDLCIGIAAGNNNDLVELVSFNVFPSGKGSTDSVSVCRGIVAAADASCQVMNMSLGGYGYDTLYHQSVGYAYDKGTIIVCAAGNDDTEKFHRPGDLPECIDVIALEIFDDPTDECRAYYSNYGTLKDISAPGSDIWSSVKGGSYGYKSGTSMASPVVTGVVALMLSVNPGLSSTDVKNIMQWTAVDLYTEGFDIYTAYGMVNALGAVDNAMNLIPGFGKTPRQEFIWRLYDIILDRYPDDAGYAHWEEEFNKGATGSDVVRCFCLSQELQNQNLSDEQFISTLYRAIFNRAPDDAGFELWYTFLYCGGSREALVAHFINSQEFANLCAVYGIPTGPINFPSQRETNPNTFIFIYRAYNICLKREPEVDGFEFWSAKMNSGELSAGDFIANVFMSQEYRNRNRSIYYYINDLYSAFFDRKPDQDGYNHWYDLLIGGYDRDAVLSDFIHSQEFINLCESMGVRPF